MNLQAIEVTLLARLIAAILSAAAELAAPDAIVVTHRNRQAVKHTTELHGLFSLPSPGSDLG
jgi:hypothetical protein